MIPGLGRSEVVIVYPDKWLANHKLRETHGFPMGFPLCPVLAAWPWSSSLVARGHGLGHLGIRRFWQRGSKWVEHLKDMGMDQYLSIPFLRG